MALRGAGRLWRGVAWRCTALVWCGAVWRVDIPFHALSLHFREHCNLLRVIRFNLRPLVVAAWDWIFEQDWDDLHLLFRRQRGLCGGMWLRLRVGVGLLLLRRRPSPRLLTKISSRHGIDAYRAGVTTTMSTLHRAKRELSLRRNTFQSVPVGGAITKIVSCDA